VITDLAAESNSPVLYVVVSVIVGVAGGGGLAQLIRVSSDRSRVMVDAAQGAVIVQTSVITDLREEIQRLRQDNAEMKVRLAALERDGR
jgi:hypothetical protein